MFTVQAHLKPRDIMFFEVNATSLLIFTLPLNIKTIQLIMYVKQLHCVQNFLSAILRNWMYRSTQLQGELAIMFKSRLRFPKCSR